MGISIKQQGFPFASFRRKVIGVDQTVPTRRGSHTPYIHLDNAASTPALRPIAEQIIDFLGWYSGVHRGTGHKSLLSSRLYDESHSVIGGFVGADPDHNVSILVKNTTEAINKAACRYPWEPDDIVLTTEMEHHSNDLPWRFHAQVEYVPIDERGILDVEAAEAMLKRFYPRIRLVAVCGASNVTGHRNDIHQLAVLAHHYGAHILVDGAQLVPHCPIDMKPDHDPAHIDFLAFSGHKIYAPFGCGVLIGPRSFFRQGSPDHTGGGTISLVTPDEIFWADLPDKEEAGSPNVVGAYALAQTLKYLQSIGMERITAYEDELTAYALARISSVPGIKIYGTSPRLGVISFNLEGFYHSQLGLMLCHEAGIGVRTGCFCAQNYVRRLMGISYFHSLEPSPLDYINHLPGMVRISLAAYNTREEIDHLVKVLKQIAAQPDYYRRNYPFDQLRQEYLPRCPKTDNWVTHLASTWS